MSSTSQLTTFSDLYTDLLQRMRLNTSVSASVEQAKRYINIALHDIHLGFDYKLPWCERTAYLRTKAPYTTGTVSISVGGVAITGSGTAWSTANSYGETNTVAKGKVIFEGETTIYQVSSVDSNTQLTLNTRYIGDEALSGATYTYFEDEYFLDSTFLRPIDFRQFSPPMGISLISRAEFRRKYPIVNVQGKPRVACIVENTGSSVGVFRKILLYPYPDQAYLIPYNYVTSVLGRSTGGTDLTNLSADSDEPTMPLRYRHAIIYHAIYHWYRDKKDDARAESAKAEYIDVVNRIVGDHDIATHTKAQIQPNLDSYQRATYTPYSGSSGRLIYDLNGDFDSFRR